MSKETLKPPLPPIDGRTEAAAERLFGLKWALRKDSTESIHKEWQTASEWIRDGYLRQAIEVLSAADQADGATASDYKERMRVEYQELTGRAGTELLMRTGTAAVAQSAAIDLTTGETAAVGEKLTENHLYLVQADNAGIQASADVTVMVRGSYSIG